MTISSLAPNRSLVGAALDRLARLNREAEERFRHSADSAGVDALRDAFARLARERARFAHELEIEAQAIGERAPWATASAARVRSVPPVGDVQRIAACTTAEDATLVEYERALSMSLPVEIERLLRGQHSSIREARDRLAQMANGVA